MTNFKSLLTRSVRVKRWAPVLLLAAGALALGARCIDRTSTYVDADGYTHITGEMVNDTNVQGTRIMLRGTLTDANGNVVATKDAPTCPPDTQPNQQTVFDIRFDNPNVPAWTTFNVRPISGIALPTALPDPQVVLFSSQAVRFTSPPLIPGLPISTKDVFFTFSLRNQTNNTYTGVQGCAAIYDQTGKVVFVTSDEIVQQNPDNSIGTAVVEPQLLTDVFMVAKNVPVGPVQVRVWLWFGPKGAPTSQYQFITTGMITIQAVAP
ncbi:MAG TPA: hypothetical protein VEZ14_03060 [Dehalococcoidia bacterium]|nr:hypothetical protein [Dehalococcoidia bacterium]